MRLLLFGATSTVCGLVAVLYTQQVLATPFNFRPATGGWSDRWRLITLPVNKPGALTPELTITEVIGYGRFSVMGQSDYYGDKTFTKCSYHPTSINKEKAINQIIYDAKEMRHPSGKHFVKMVHSFKAGLPYKIASWFKSTALHKYVKALPIGQCIVTEYAGKETIDSHFKRQNVKKQRDAYDLIYQLLEALAFLHKEGITYNDLNPSDVFVSVDENNRAKLKLVDFDSSSTFKRTLANVAMGKYTGRAVEYMPPEALSKDKTYNLLVGETWSVGAMIYHLLTERAVTGQLMPTNKRFDSKLFKSQLRGYLKPHNFVVPPIGIYSNPPRPISDFLMDIFYKLLDTDPTRRLAPAAFLEKYPYNESIARELA
ncbi:kinase-like domain-containing protein [Syncephalis plumigaleata]|nr:kinase-like domain-containing protein [Syncephalis plumigaleata]